MFQKWKKPYDNCLSLLDLFHLALSPPVPSMSLQMLWILIYFWEREKVGERAEGENLQTDSPLSARALIRTRCHHPGDHEPSQKPRVAQPTDRAIQCPVLFLILKEWLSWDAWVAQSVGCPTLVFNSGHDLRIMRSSPESGSELSCESVQDALSLCKINK